MKYVTIREIRNIVGCGACPRTLTYSPLSDSEDIILPFSFSEKGPGDEAPWQGNRKGLPLREIHNHS